MIRSLTIFCLLLLTNYAVASTVLITGSNRGIGLEFATQYAAKGWDVIATSRSPGDDDELKALAEAHPNVVIEQLDVTDVGEISDLAEKYAETPIDLLINNAGLLGNPRDQIWGSLDQETFEQLMAVNVFGPMKVSEAFANHVVASEQKKIVVLSTSISSIEGMTSPARLPILSTSKAAVNMAMRIVAMQLKESGVVVAMLHPGGVQTRMMRQAAGMTLDQASEEVDIEYPASTITAAESVAAMIAVIESLDGRETGILWNNDGTRIPF